MSSNPQHIENLNNLKSLGFDVDEYLIDTMESWGYDEQVDMVQGVISEIRPMALRIKELEAELSTKNATLASITEHEIDSAITGEDSEFEKGAKALFNAILNICANSWHACPERNKGYQRDNDLLLSRADSALMDVAYYTSVTWRDLNAAHAKIKELEAALEEAFTISERSNEQNPSNFDQDLAEQHNEDICEIYHILKSLKDSE